MTENRTPISVVKQHVQERIIRNADIVVDALLSVAQDPKAPAAARAGASATLLRSGGFFAVANELREKELYELTFEEIQAKIAKLESDGLQAEQATSPTADSLFD